jgi:hypothetical protein
MIHPPLVVLQCVMERIPMDPTSASKCMQIVFHSNYPCPCARRSKHPIFSTSTRQIELFLSCLKVADTAPTSFLLYPRHILPTNRIPRRHVLLHARREAGFLAAGQRCTGFGDAAFEAVFVYFLCLVSFCVVLCFAMLCRVRVEGTESSSPYLN